ncbi:hypothetical protein PFMG_01460 [Plasmodium falciparum IGH-CR14]|uniref:Actin-related protein n=1 Tax=Plasmodium falciparum IGH-CR14 TaxID=580059 RepID=A0A0L1I8A6_PLAFA|nr:hypothetical protein PFMG_01460 [Plasmodium falciparum IGH-CR14]
MSAPVNIDIPKLILDNGAGLIKGGILPSYSQIEGSLCEEIEPKFILPNCVGQIRKKNIFHISDSCQSICEYFCHRPHVDGLLLDLELETKIWEKIFSCRNTVGGKINEMGLCVTESYLTPAYIKQGVIELLFEYFNMNQIVIVSSQTMLPFSYIGLNLGQYDILNPPIYRSRSSITKKVDQVIKRRRRSENCDIDMNKLDSSKDNMMENNLVTDSVINIKKLGSMDKTNEENVNSMNSVNNVNNFIDDNSYESKKIRLSQESVDHNKFNENKGDPINIQKDNVFAQDDDKNIEDVEKYENSGHTFEKRRYNKKNTKSDVNIFTNKHIYLKNIECYNKYSHKLYIDDKYQGDNWEDFYFNSFFNLNNYNNNNIYDDDNNNNNYLFEGLKTHAKSYKFNNNNVVRTLYDNNYLGKNFSRQDPNFIIPEKVDLYRNYYGKNFQDIKMFKKNYRNKYINNFYKNIINGNYNLSLRNPCALYIDVGFSHTYVLPYIEYKLIEYAVLRTKISGSILNSYLKSTLSYKHVNLEHNELLVENIKERACYVSLDYLKELEKEKTRLENIKNQRIKDKLDMRAEILMKELEEEAQGKGERDKEKKKEMDTNMEKKTMKKKKKKKESDLLTNSLVKEDESNSTINDMKVNEKDNSDVTEYKENWSNSYDKKMNNILTKKKNDSCGSSLSVSNKSDDDMYIKKRRTCNVEEGGVDITEDQSYMSDLKSNVSVDKSRKSSRSNINVDKSYTNDEDNKSNYNNNSDDNNNNSDDNNKYSDDNNKYSDDSNEYSDDSNNNNNNNNNNNKYSDDSNKYSDDNNKYNIDKCNGRKNKKLQPHLSYQYKLIDYNNVSKRQINKVFNTLKSNYNNNCIYIDSDYDYKEEFSNFIIDDKDDNMNIKDMSIKVGDSSKGKEDVINLTNERIGIPEILFNPQDINLEHCSIVELVYRCISLLPKHIQKYFVSQIYISGGSTKFRNFKHRLYKELRQVFPSDWDINIYSHKNSLYSNYIGTYVWLSDPSIYNYNVITREQYFNFGKESKVWNRKKDA